MGRKATPLILLSIIISSAYSAEKARFDFYRVYKVTAENEDQLSLFQHVLDNPDGFKFLSNPPTTIGAFAELLVPPHKFGEWSELIEKFELNVNLQSSNYQEVIDQEEQSYMKRRNDYDWSTYFRYNETYVWMKELARDYSHVSIVTVGRTLEGREILGLRINVGNTPKKSIVFEGTIHANEWIATTTNTFVINQLLTSRSSEIRQLLETFDWWFVPILNVDGYEFAWNVDRTWRKTRGPTVNPSCQGADPNRNFDFFWGQFGGSTNPCANNYYGDRAASETEIRQWSNFLRTVPNLYGYLSLHTFGRLLMTPFAFTRDLISNSELLMELGSEATSAISSVRGTRYILGRTSVFFGPTAGTSIDYIIDRYGAEIVYVYELGTSHVMPPEEIEPIGREIFASVVAIFRGVVDRGLV